MNPMNSLHAQAHYRHQELLAEADRARLARAVRSGRFAKTHRSRHGRWRP